MAGLCDIENKDKNNVLGAGGRHLICKNIVEMDDN